MPAVSPLPLPARSLSGTRIATICRPHRPRIIASCQRSRRHSVLAHPATPRRPDDSMSQAEQTRVFVNGNNVMGSRLAGWWRDRTWDVRRLVAKFIPLARGHRGEWTIVFNGREPPSMTLSPECLIVVYTGHGRSDGADDRRVELVHERTPASPGVAGLHVRREAAHATEGARHPGHGFRILVEAHRHSVRLHRTQPPPDTGLVLPTASTKVTTPNRKASDHMHRRNRQSRAIEMNGIERTHNDPSHPPHIQTHTKSRTSVAWPIIWNFPSNATNVSARIQNPYRYASFEPRLLSTLLGRPNGQSSTHHPTFDSIEHQPQRCRTSLPHRSTNDVPAIPIHFHSTRFLP